jgi:hypothetical protein
LKGTGLVTLLTPDRIRSIVVGNSIGADVMMGTVPRGERCRAE